MTSRWNGPRLSTEVEGEEERIGLVAITCMRMVVVVITSLRHDCSSGSRSADDEATHRTSRSSEKFLEEDARSNSTTSWASEEEVENISDASTLKDSPRADKLLRRPSLKPPPSLSSLAPSFSIALERI